MRRPTHVLRRGEVSDPGDVVLPGVPAVLSPLTGRDVKSRLDVARWLVAPNQPLTARVFVNRVWEHYFGMGLVPTENNFGLSGEHPSQPELLDWLAAEFMAGGWSMKALHRLIVGSATYRQSSHIRPDLAGVDPSNRLLARQSRLRLEAEAIRDCALAVSGLLSRKIGGPSVFPYQPAGIMTGRADRGTWVVSPGADRYRRGMYTHFWRLTPHPFLRLFDAPDATAACTRRIRSNTPLQALTLLNDPTFTECAGPWQTACGTSQDVAIASGFAAPSASVWRGNRRLPRFARSSATLTISASMRPEPVLPIDRRDARAGNERDRPSRTPDEWVGFARAILNLDEFITRE